MQGEGEMEGREARKEGMESRKEQPKSGQTSRDREGTLDTKGKNQERKEGDEVYTMLAVLKWSLLGMHFFMEMWTIVSLSFPCPASDNV